MSYSLTINPKEPKKISYSPTKSFNYKESQKEMPYSPKAPCRFNGCPELTSREYCEKHRKTTNDHYNKYQRDSECNKRYNYQWKKIRNEFFNLNPICEMCKCNGKITPTQEIHHRVSLSSGGTHDFENLEALCKSCHSKISAESGERWRNKRVQM